MTAVEWLEQKMDGTINTMPSGNRSLVKKLLKQSKEIEKQQIIDFAFYFRHEEVTKKEIEDHYNKTFKQ